MNRALLYFALLVSYFGDYCSLIGLFEMGKTYGGSIDVVWLYIAYSLPPLLFFLVSERWAANQKRPARQLAALSLLGALSAASLFYAESYLHVWIVSFLLGLVKQAGRVLLNVFIKFNYDEKIAVKVYSETVTLRYFIMVFGGAVGAHWGGLGRFDLVFTVDAVSFLIAAGVFLGCKEREAVVPTSETSERLLPTFSAISGLVLAFGALPLVCFAAQTLQVGLFMAIEYPLLTTELQVPTSWIGVVWAGHVIGTLAAQWSSGKWLSGQGNLGKYVVVTSAGTLAAFGVLGAFGGGLSLVSVQMAVAVFFMVSVEIFSGSHLMQVASTEKFPTYNLLFRSLEMGLGFVASLVPVIVAGALTLQQTNLLSAGAFTIIAIVISVALPRLVGLSGRPYGA